MMKVTIKIFQVVILATLLIPERLNSQHTQPIDTILYKPVSVIELNADGEGGQDTYEIIKEAFGPYCLEVPDLYSNNHQGFNHIQEGEDEEAGPCFIFYLHRDLDWDRDQYPDVTDRQRNEIKIYDGSSETGKARQGEVFRYRWKIFIGKSMTISLNFCHFFQLKAVGGDDSHPVMTLSGSVNGGTPEVEILHSPSKDDTQLTKNNWEIARGKWLGAECIALMDDEGYLKFSLKSLSGETILETEQLQIDMWREGSSYIRPKWGIYRSLSSKHQILNDTDTIKFAAITIEELKLKSEISELRDDISTAKHPEFSGLNNALLIENCPKGFYHVSIYDLSGKTILQSTGNNHSADFITIRLDYPGVKNKVLIVRLISNNKVYNDKLILKQ
jgi:hypothetical protein